MKMINHIFPSFHFKPIKLSLEVNRLQKRYKHTEQVSEQLTSIKLPNLLDKIRQTNINEIPQFAITLKPIDINILATEYPYENETKSTIEKVIIIFKERYVRIIGRRFWGHFQRLPFDERIISILQYSLQHEDGNFLGLKPSIREQYNLFFSTYQPHEIIELIAYGIGSEKKQLNKSFSEWKIEQESKLSFELLKLIFQEYIKEKWFVEIQGQTYIEKVLEKMRLKKYKKIINRYLESFPYEDFHHHLFTQVVKRLGDPRKSLQYWDSMSDLAIKKVKMRILQDELFNFFESDSERFNYWKKYISHMNSVDYIQDPPVVAMYFGEFAVVEFARIGNAAYFYREEEFKKYLSHKLKVYVKESDLKDQDAPYFICKIDHRGYWHTRYDEYMVNFLNGNLHYRHTYAF